MSRVQEYVSRISTSSKKRLTYIDFAKGATILLMLLDHIYGKGAFITSFHMPLFFIISGYFYKEEAFKKLFIKRGLKFLGLYYLIAIISNIIGFLWSKFYVGYTWTVADLKYAVKCIVLGYDRGLHWFLIALAFVTLAYWFIYKCFKKSKVVYVLLLVVSCYVGFRISQLGLYIPYNMDINLLCIGFFAVGHMWKKYGDHIKPWVKYLGLFFALGVWLVGIRNGGIVIALRLFPKFPLCYISAICGTYAMMYVYKQLDKIPYLAHVMRWYGRNTLPIMLLGNIFRISLGWTEDFPISNLWISFAVQLAIITLLLAIYNLIKKKIKSRN